MTAIAIGRFSFRTKGDAIKEIRRILHGTPPGERLAGEDLELVTALFGMHEEAAKEAAYKGVALGFCVKEHSYHNIPARSFYALHLRTVTPFSYRTCLDNRRSVPNHVSVMRAAISASQHRAKKAAFGTRTEITCPRCKRVMTFPEAHADHEPPNKFRTIVQAYCDTYGTPLCVSNFLGDKFVNPAEWNRWVAFHDARAVLTVVCAGCNLKGERKKERNE